MLFPVLIAKARRSCATERPPTAAKRYLCRDCGRRSTADPRPNGYTEEQRELILRAYQERSSLRGLTRTFGVSRHTVTSWLKKKPLRSRP